ncbi:ABC transporter ATP-binding protein [Actinomadura luteofluorescens]|uniref:Branched-chain amino acid transport system ATP-binding protein n=1 Tax=Actinomadura luteofluorescens TaxID=46163 RepID=A0A7Y9ESM9_9ACTN|nr:ABC transporter ATP-binding protein [Actinomadura luteofluorescens]NYD52400.1 branched-chain amino acid transport system ATP-binding protein [Actinomadura luteofluorescens]
MLEVKGLTVAYGAVRALGGVDLSVDEGSVTAVLGANGAGKTTLLRAVSGLLRPRSGRVALDGADITGLAVEEIVRLGVAHVPQNGGVITELTVRDNLRLGGLWRRDRAALARRVAEMYELFPPLAQRRSRLAATLSGGERQMLALARALTGAPRLLLVDEPSLGLAPRVVAQLMAVLRRLSDEDGRTVLLVEQNARSALSVADRAVVLDLGSVVADETAAAIAADDRLRHAYLGF